MKHKTIWAYYDNKKTVDVVQAALDNNKTVEEMKALIIRQNPDYKITFKVE
jgi:hypothetical protein